MSATPLLPNFLRLVATTLRALHKDHGQPLSASGARLLLSLASVAPAAEANLILASIRKLDDTLELKGGSAETKSIAQTCTDKLCARWAEAREHSSDTLELTFAARLCTRGCAASLLTLAQLGAMLSQLQPATEAHAVALCTFVAEMLKQELAVSTQVWAKIDQVALLCSCSWRDALVACFVQITLANLSPGSVEFAGDLQQLRRGVAERDIAFSKLAVTGLDRALQRLVLDYAACSSELWTATCDVSTEAAVRSLDTRLVLAFLGQNETRDSQRSRDARHRIHRCTCLH